MTIGRLGAVVLDTADPDRLARFYEAVLGARRSRVDGDWIDLDTGLGFSLSFQHAPDHQPPRWPDPARPQQFHLDIDVDDIDVAHQQVIAAGATLLSTAEEEHGFRVYADPAGHPFCLVFRSDD